MYNDHVNNNLRILKSNLVHGPDEAYSDQWNLGNVSSVHRRENKQAVSNIFAEVFAKIVVKNLYTP